MNAAIRIGFELSRYEFLEPQFEEFIDRFYEPESGLPINGPVFLAKENNVTTEQTFQITFQISNVGPPGEGIDPATPGQDYQASQVSIMNFPPTTQRQDFSFILLTDNTPEAKEAFQIGSSPNNQPGVPVYVAPSALFSQTFIIIEDDDGKILILRMLNILLCVCIRRLIIWFHLHTVCCCSLTTSAIKLVSSLLSLENSLYPIIQL